MKPTQEWIFNESLNKKSIIRYYKDVIDPCQQRHLFETFVNMDDFIGAPKVPRTQKWYDINNRYFCEAWTNRYDRWKSFHYTQFIQDLQSLMQTFINDNASSDMKVPTFNSCLVNKYNNGTEFIAPHRDSHVSFGSTPTILNLSLGATRKISFERILFDERYSRHLCPDRSNEHLNFDIELSSGSILVMGGETQKYFTHEIPTCSTTECRISCTFREKVL